LKSQPVLALFVSVNVALGSGYGGDDTVKREVCSSLWLECIDYARVMRQIGGVDTPEVPWGMDVHGTHARSCRNGGRCLGR
jgi:hypothetical protein